MFGLSSTQIAALVERVATVAFASAVSAGYVLDGDKDFYISMIVAVVSGIVGIVNNRGKRLAERAAKANPDAVILAGDAVAAGTKSVNIISARDYEVSLKPR